MSCKLAHSTNMCFTVRGIPQDWQVGESSPLNKYEWVTWEWPIRRNDYNALLMKLYQLLPQWTQRDQSHLSTLARRCFCKCLQQCTGPRSSATAGGIFTTYTTKYKLLCIQQSCCVVQSKLICIVSQLNWCRNSSPFKCDITQHKHILF